MFSIKIHSDFSKRNSLHFQTRSSFEDPYTSVSGSNLFSSLFNNFYEENSISSVEKRRSSNFETLKNAATSPLSPISSPFSVPAKSLFAIKPHRPSSPTLYDLNFILKSLNLSSIKSEAIFDKKEELIIQVLVLLYVVAWRCPDDGVVEEDVWKVGGLHNNIL